MRVWLRQRGGGFADKPSPRESAFRSQPAAAPPHLPADDPYQRRRRLTRETRAPYGRCRHSREHLISEHISHPLGEMRNDDRSISNRKQRLAEVVLFFVHFARAVNNRVVRSLC